MSPLPEEYDIIVCGGGSTGCVVAGRYVAGAVYGQSIMGTALTRMLA